VAVRLLGLRVQIPPGTLYMFPVFCVFKSRSLRWADHLSRGVLSGVVVSECDREVRIIRRP
jgi:hypothetical protein